MSLLAGLGWGPEEGFTGGIEDSAGFAGGAEDTAGGTEVSAGFAGGTEDMAGGIEEVGAAVGGCGGQLEAEMGMGFWNNWNNEASATVGG